MEGKPTNETKTVKKSQPGEGIRKLQSTTFFRVTNFELYVKPNKFVMSLGLASLAVAVGLIGYMHYEQRQLEQRVGPVYKVITEDGDYDYRQKKSKWDI